MVDITNLANMFSQKTGAESSIATMVINAVIGYMMQRGLGGMMAGGDQGGGIMSALSNFMGGGQSQSTSTGQPQKKKGLLDDVMGSLGV